MVPCMIWQGWHSRFEGYSSLLRMSTTSSFGLLDFVFLTGVLEWLGPVNSHKSIRSSAEIRGDTSAFRSSNLMESLDFRRRKLILKVIELETWCSLKLLLIWQPQSVTTQLDRNGSFPYNSELVWGKLSIQKSSRAVPNAYLPIISLFSVEVVKKKTGRQSVQTILVCDLLMNYSLWLRGSQNSQNSASVPQHQRINKLARKHSQKGGAERPHAWSGKEG